MAYRHGRKPIREAYEDHFPVLDAREVTVHRVVNIVEKRSLMPWAGMEYDRGFYDDQWYGAPRDYQEARECHGEGSYPPSERRYYDDSPNFRRNPSPPRNDGPYSQQSYGRDDLRHQLGSRSSRRARPYFRNRGRGSGPPVRKDHNDHKVSPPVVVKRERSPACREAQPPARSGSNTSNRSFSPDRDRGCTHQPPQKRHKSSVPVNHAPGSSAEGSPHSSGSSKEKNPASVAETEEVVAASMEPELTPEEDFKARRLEAIKAKALEIEKDYRQDCETFRTVVKMLVAKEPSLDNLLQAPLDKNLLEIKQRCLDGLRQFVKELDETITRGGDGPDHDGPHTSPTTCVKMEEDFPQQCSTNPTDTDIKQEGKNQPENIGDPTPVPAGNQGGGGGGKQTGSTEDSIPVPAGNQEGGGGGKQTGNTEDSIPVAAGNQGGGGGKQTGNTEDPISVPAGNQGGGGGGGKQTGNTEDSTTVPEKGRPGRRENLATPGPDHSEPKKLPSKNPPAQQDSTEVLAKRMQLYNIRGERFSYAQLSNPKVWQDITYARPGWIPNHLPYLQPGDRYWELKANSTVVSTVTPLCKKGKKTERVACGVTCYNHVEGPWCEVQSENGTKICFLAVPPPTARLNHI